MIIVDVSNGLYRSMSYGYTNDPKMTCHLRETHSVLDDTFLALKSCHPGLSDRAQRSSPCRNAIWWAAGESRSLSRYGVSIRSYNVNVNVVTFRIMVFQMAF